MSPEMAAATKNPASQDGGAIPRCSLPIGRHRPHLGRVSTPVGCPTCQSFLDTPTGARPETS